MAVDVLACALAQAWIGIPRQAVVQVIEYDLAPLPAAARYVGGVAVHGDELLVSIALSQSFGTHARRTRGVVVNAPGPTRWCVEVSSVQGFAGAAASPRSARDAALPAWLQRSRLTSGQVAVLLDVGAMIDEVVGGRAR